jgi:hypothetical protein|tara:strand:+ start:1856 stop:1969 length:114 start_codon:yes stop_codon:yes gene_type:complete
MREGLPDYTRSTNVRIIGAFFAETIFKPVLINQRIAR